VTTVEPIRYEIKLPCPSTLLPQVQSWVRLHPAHWRVAYPPRQVNNVYFDTADCACMNENLGGVAGRAKLRLRWYGEVLDTIDHARLELKRKEGKVGWKEICPLELALDLTSESWREVQQWLRDAVDDQARMWLAQFPHPVLINHYHRAYYVTPDGSLRLTIDTRLRAYDQRASARPNLRRPAPIADRIVVELKAGADPASSQRLSDALARFPLRPDRHSKYVNGMLAAPTFDT
jgi:SPX domain protein involved in polyphosphate accumulation